MMGGYAYVILVYIIYIYIYINIFNYMYVCRDMYLCIIYIVRIKSYAWYFTAKAINNLFCYQTLIKVTILSSYNMMQMTMCVMYISDIMQMYKICQKIPCTILFRSYFLFSSEASPARQGRRGIHATNLIFSHFER